jgi:RHS repeat-associated protein
MVTDAAGNVQAEQNFDPWGRRRAAQTWSYIDENLPLQLPVWLYRGYTGHEHMPQFRLINMNGRMYDPELARMLSPDNVLQSAGYTQNYNRYSYALNNPLRYIDPDGNEPIS